MSIYDRPPARPLFHVGLVCATKEAIKTLHELRVMPSELVLRHQYGDWGNLNEHDRRANTIALEVGDRIFSAYEIRGKRIWVITEADRLTTTLFLPEEY